MDTKTDPQADTPAATEPQGGTPTPSKKSSLPRTVRWATRITSIPIFALVLVPLVPLLAHFGVAARDDRIITFGLCGVCLGFLLGWRWASVGGGISLLSVGAVLTQSGGISGDPFSIAFAIQAILFLISAFLNLDPDRAPIPAVGLIKKAAVALLAMGAVAGALMIYRGPGAIPVPKEKERFVGVWENTNGLTIEITTAGEAIVTEQKDSKLDEWNTPVKPGERKTFNVTFREDQLELADSGLGVAKSYHVDRRPHAEGKQMKMTLNASVPFKRTGGIVLVKKPTPEAGAKGRT
jgi:hypothetical protein